SKGQKTVENELLSALATLVGQTNGNQQITLVNISRASSTEEGEHAARQVLSLEIAAPNIRLPSPAAMNSLLPETIKVFKIVRPSDNFSARRSCDTRTYEYVIPTYVFAPPPAETGLQNEYQPELMREMLDTYYPDPYPDDDNSGQGSLFTTLKRAARPTTPRSLPRHGPSLDHSRQEVSPPASPTNPSLSRNQAIKQHVFEEKGASPSSGNAFTRFFTQFRGRKGSKTLSRQKSGGRLDDDEMPSGAAEESSASRSTSAPPRGLTLGRTKSTLSRRSRREELEPRLDETAPAAEDTAPRYHDPIVLPLPTRSSISALRSYRITPDQLDSLRNIVAIYRGTHNWHNYIPGAVYEDGRCYIRVMDMQVSDPEVRPAGEPASGMEFVRVKVRARAFARLQLRKMVALAILVVRTNTPRSLVASSFGIVKFDFPESPPHGMIFDT
ncbi:tRNA pseudouridine synthase 1, partial [Cladochytrium tenue]